MITHARFPDGEEKRLEGSAADFAEHGFPEVEDCTGTGLNYCDFNFRKGRVCLKVQTRGEYYKGKDSPIIIRWENECRTRDEVDDDYARTHDRKTGKLIKHPKK